MTLSSEGLKLIKSFEGCRLAAYQDPAGIWTIGYGHTRNVKKGQVITQLQADEFLQEDIAWAVAAVNSTGMDMTQGEFDGLVSFTFNCGTKNLNKLVSGRTMDQIKEKILLYNKSGGTVLTGLMRRRRAELQLMTGAAPDVAAELRKDFQRFLNQHDAGLAVDGIIGSKTKTAWNTYKNKAGILI